MSQFVPTYYWHHSTRRVYKATKMAIVSDNGEHRGDEAVVYEDQDGNDYVRSADEFYEDIGQGRKRFEYIGPVHSYAEWPVVPSWPH